MKHITFSHPVLIITFVLTSCVSTTPTNVPTQIESQSPSPVPTLPSATIALTKTMIPTLSATLEPEQAKETLKKLLQEPVDCRAPCFWGIYPGETTFDEAKNIFTHLGLQVESTVYQGKEFYGIRYDFDSGLSIIVTLKVQNNVVMNIKIGIASQTQKTEKPREWFAFSPETLISQYGEPTKVDFFVDWGPRPAYSITIYFATVDMIIEYGGYGIISGTVTSPQVCPLTDQFDSVRIWLGEDPENPPTEGIPLESATSLTMKKFSNLMTGNPNEACIALKTETFP